ncbi:GAK system CofD-like protein [Desulfovibrio aminophilus]|nr:GAK system CofD-like protein [Desulfovibrio aminophilus]MCM0756436.1 GAK system CofD-like protein [Desulfovibrio aminophilus]
MARVTVCREIEVPDPLRAARFARAPELGPRLLFFSGGTALRGLSRALLDYTHNSIHVITPFDSGGSSATLRRAFQMPAIGDVRNRLMALADQSLRGNPEVVALFAHRFAAKAAQAVLVEQLERMIKGRHPLVARIPDPMRKIVRNHLAVFREHMPGDFDLRGASIGNLVLSAGYLNNRRMFDPVVYIFSRLIQARGEVRPVVNKNLHLGARLADGRVVVGQHRLTGKECPPPDAAIEELFLTASLDSAEPVEVAIRDKMRRLIGSADLICYPPGSFFTSLMANLLPRGVGRAVARARCPKVYVPSAGRDPEAVGLGLGERVDLLLRTLTRDDPKRIKAADVLQYVLLDTRGGEQVGGADRARLARRGVTVVDCPLVSEDSGPYIDGRKLAEALLSLS